MTSAERSRSFYRHLGAAGLASRTKPDWDAAIVAELVSRLPPVGDVLDVGCGYGRIALPLAQRGYKVTGLDISANLLRHARREARYRGLTVRFDKGTMTALPYPADSFDAVVSLWSAFYELLEESEQLTALRAMARVLRPGGIGVVEGPTYAAPTSEEVESARRVGEDARLAANLIAGRRYLQYAHDEASLLRVCAGAGLSQPRVEIAQWAGQRRQLLLFSA